MSNKSFWGALLGADNGYAGKVNRAHSGRPGTGIPIDQYHAAVQLRSSKKTPRRVLVKKRKDFVRTLTKFPVQKFSYKWSYASPPVATQGVTSQAFVTIGAIWGQGGREDDLNRIVDCLAVRAPWGQSSGSTAIPVTGKSWGQKFWIQNSSLEVSVQNVNSGSLPNGPCYVDIYECFCRSNIPISNPGDAIVQPTSGSSTTVQPKPPLNYDVFWNGGTWASGEEFNDPIKTPFDNPHFTAKWKVGRSWRWYLATGECKTITIPGPSRYLFKADQHFQMDSQVWNHYCASKGLTRALAFVWRAANLVPNSNSPIPSNPPQMLFYAQKKYFVYPDLGMYPSSTSLQGFGGPQPPRMVVEEEVGNPIEEKKL